MSATIAFRKIIDNQKETHADEFMNNTATLKENAGTLISNVVHIPGADQKLSFAMQQR